MKKKKTNAYNTLPKSVTLTEFQTYFEPYLSLPKAGIIPSSERLCMIFNYILYHLDTGCQWDKLPIRIDPETHKKEIHHVNVWRWFNRWSHDGSFEKAFMESVRLLKNKKKLKFACVNGDGTNSVAKKGAIKQGIRDTNTKKDKRSSASLTALGTSSLPLSAMRSTRTTSRFSIAA
jgi:transposase